MLAARTTLQLGGFCIIHCRYFNGRRCDPDCEDMRSRGDNVVCYCAAISTSVESLGPSCKQEAEEERIEEHNRDSHYPLAVAKLISKFKTAIKDERQ